ncbi:MAG TPA: hypothetical protein VEH09_10745 [Thermodesulfobacteriota bacterium]|nr:hypothetical protein [Thermodesulfobacteriota bacterium]
MVVKKAIAKKAPATKKAAARGRTKAGDNYVCGVCGLAITVDEDCGCEEACDIICCSEPMKRRRARK